MKAILILLLAIANIALAANINQAQTYKYKLTVINELDQDGYVAICNAPIDENNVTLCGIPTLIKIGANDIFAPAYENMYPIFTTLDEKSYSCASPSNPQKQLPLSSSRLIMKSFILDKDGKRIAILCQ
jgi:hypothetical protein